MLDLIGLEPADRTESSEPGQAAAEVVDLTAVEEEDELGRTIVTTKAKYGMARGTAARVIGSNRTQWKLENGRNVQRAHEGDGWRWA